MKISLLWLKEFIDLPQGVDLQELADALTHQTVEVEEVTNECLVIDNKSLTNRPDLWGHLGIARELSSIYDCELREPNIINFESLPRKSGLIDICDPKVAHGISLLNIHRTGNLPETPEWMRQKLLDIGQNSINLYVDITNYVMFALGQPAHVYDLKKLELPLSATLTKIPKIVNSLLGDCLELPSGVAVITDANQVVSLAGVVGGSDTEFNKDSHSILIEVGSFTEHAVRRTIQITGVRTEAALRFSKGICTQIRAKAVSMVVRLLAELDPSSEIVGYDDYKQFVTPEKEVSVSVDFINKRIGINYSTEQVINILQPLGFKIDTHNDHLLVRVPNWRSTGDVSTPSDIVEEVARSIGYANIPKHNVCITLRKASNPPSLLLQRRIREYMASRVQAQEILTYPWVEDKFLQMLPASFSEGTIEFEGAPAPDRARLRPSLVSNLLWAVDTNISRYQSFALFELGSVYHLDVDRKPISEYSVAGVFVGNDRVELFKKATGALEGLNKICGINDLATDVGEREPSIASNGGPLGVISYKGLPVGTVALVDTHSLLRGMDKNIHVVWFEFSLKGVSICQSRTNRFTPISIYPSSSRDISFFVPLDVTWKMVEHCVKNSNKLIISTHFIDEYRDALIGEGKHSFTLRLDVGSMERTLTSDEVTEIRDDVMDHLTRTLHAEMRI